MARQKEFNRDEVLMKAMETFWHYGYEGTSIKSLVENMGINRGSLYDTFGDKRSLFHEAIAHYDSKIVTKAIARLRAPGASKQAIINQFYNLIDRAVADTDHKGCLLTNTVVEIGARDPETAKQVTTNIQRIEKSFQKALTTAKKKGEISQKHDINALAKFLTCCLQGLRVISKVNPDREALRDMAKIAISVLDQ